MNIQPCKCSPQPLKHRESWAYGDVNVMLHAQHRSKANGFGSPKLTETTQRLWRPIKHPSNSQKQECYPTCHPSTFSTVRSLPLSCSSRFLACVCGILFPAGWRSRSRLERMSDINSTLFLSTFYVSNPGFDHCIGRWSDALFVLR